MYNVIGYDPRRAFLISKRIRTRKVNQEPKITNLLNSEATRLFDAEKKPRAKGE